MNIVLDLPLVAGSLMFYAAGVASVLAQRFELLTKLVDLQGHRTGGGTAPLAEVLAPNGLAQRPVAAHYEDVTAIVREALGLGMEPVDDGLQMFEVLRLCLGAQSHRLFQECVEDYALKSRKLGAMSQIDMASEIMAQRDRHRVIEHVSELCDARGAHLLAESRTFDIAEGRRWASPLAERLAEDVTRNAELHPLVSALRGEKDAILAGA